MKFNFNKDTSKILDYLIFPVVYFDLEESIEHQDESLIKAIKEDYFDFSEKMRNKLNQFKDEINQFYQKEIYSNYDFASILMHAYSVYEYTDIKDYFKDLLDLNPDKFKEKFIKSLLSMEDVDGDTIESLEKESPTDYINNLKIDSANKWNLFMIIQNPYLYLEKYVSLLNKIESIFNASYEKYEERIIEVGHDLANRLSSNTNETFTKITYNSINYDFEAFEACDLYISFVMPYALRFIGLDSCRMVWGLEMEYSFAKIHEINEDKLTQRVKIFKALGDKTRYETLKLVAKGISSIKTIADELGVSSATISYHMNEFLTTGILYMSKESKQKFDYRVDYDKLEEVFKDLKEDLNFK